MRPDPTVVSHILSAAGIAGDVTERGPGVVVEAVAADVPAVLAALKACELDFRMLLDLFASDTGEEIEITYHLRSLARDEDLFVRCRIPYDGELASVWNTYPSALAPEREAAELLGFRLAGHPNPKRLLTTDGVEPLLRKSVAIRSAEEVRAR